MRREELDANDYFADLRDVALPDLKYDNYGGAIGGPVIRDQVFFFAGLEWKKIRRSTSPTFRTIPTGAMRGGDFSRLSTTIRDPLTGQPFPGNIIPANRITADGRVRRTFSRDDIGKLEHGAARAATILEKSGATHVFPHGIVAAHPGGSARVGDVVDTNLETAYDNL